MTMPAPDAALTIYCEEASHIGRRFEWHYDRIQHPQAGRIWLDHTRVPREYRSTGSSQSQTIHILDEHDHVLGENEPVIGTTRHRYKLECERCGVKLDCRGEVLNPIFDTIVDAGVLEVSLTGLAARVSG